MAYRILIIEDDQAISMALRDRLLSEGYAAESVHDGLIGLEKALAVSWDLLILDIMLPSKGGLEVCRDLRAKEIDVPVLILTARDDTVDKVVGLKMGADDYLTKPFEMVELLARVEALLRRRGRSTIRPDEYRIGEYQLNVSRNELTREGVPIRLTSYEFKLLKFLCERRGDVIDRDTLLNAVWGYESDIYSRTIDVHIASLRKKLGDTIRQEFILTVRGRGYKLS
ncbi:MAG: response regulator transcription factor [Spirochaetales bacterium]|jgi:two-component system, OmpR family, alkaline phosphatase synthesis response regulator PhoP|nr:response regulator transcription factor [Spirochaetales bacterium]